MTDFKMISPGDIKGNPFQMIGGNWMLITSGSPDNYNTMTASWGAMGVLWNKKICTIYVRPQRYTYEFLEKNDFFTLSFFSEKYRNALKFCGSNSGRDYNKARETGLTAFSTDNSSVGFAEAELIIECRKIYFQDINPENFLHDSISGNYPSSDYHRVYTGEIIKVYSKE